MKDDGTRREGELDKFLDKGEVSVVLFKAAETFRRNAQDPSQAEFAAKLYMLAGKYSSLISLLNALITPTDQDDDNKRWVEFVIYSFCTRKYCYLILIYFADTGGHNHNSFTLTIFQREH